MKVALLGLPQSGKRTLFTLLTGRAIPPGRKENECIEGVARIRDPRVDAISLICKPEKTKYAEVVYTLCPDAKENDEKREWLEQARRCDLLCILVRSFSSTSVYHASGSVDAQRDRGNLSTELFLADLDMVDKRLERIGKEKRAGQNPAQVLEEKTLLKCKEAIAAGKNPAELNLDSHEKGAIRSLGLLTLIPVLWVYNVDEKDVKDDENADRMTVSCAIEQEIMAMEDEKERMEYLKDMGLQHSGVDRMNRAVYHALGLMSFYTMGSDEVRAWTIHRGSVAPVAAGKIHTDIERGFIRVEVIKYDDLVSLGSEAAVRKNGKLETKGKDYVIQDGDICQFLFNV